MTPAEIRAAGKAQARDWPPLSDEQVEQVAVLLRPDEPEAVAS